MARNVMISAALIALSGSGCAQLKFGGPNDPGVPFYAPQPMIARAVTEDCTVSTSMIVVPNTASTRTVSTTVGIGSNKLEAAFQNGMLTSFGQTTDAKIPETLTAISEMVGTLSGPTASLHAQGQAGAQAAKSCSPIFEVFRVDAGGTLTKVYPTS